MKSFRQQPDLSKHAVNAAVGEDGMVRLIDPATQASDPSPIASGEPALFGVGWGLSGVCPGPHIVGLAAKPFASSGPWLMLAMVGVGMKAVQLAAYYDLDAVYDELDGPIAGALDTLFDKSRQRRKPFQ